MFTSIEIENFKSIIHDTVTLGPLTVVVGANGSGKSNLIKALQYMQRVVLESPALQPGQAFDRVG